jgi:hypothetical protein
MPLAVLPTRGALDLGPALTNARAPVANELSAVHVERIKDRIIELANEVGLSDGSTAGSLREAIAALEASSTAPLLDVSMTDAVTAAAQLGTPAFVRSGGNNTWDPPVSPVPTLTAGIAVPSYPTDTGLRLTLPTTTASGGNISGTWMYPLTGLASIPTAGVAIEVDIAHQDSGVLFFVAPIARFSGGSMSSGMVMQHESAFSQINSYQVYTETGQPFPRIAGASSVLNYGFPTTPNFNRAINKVRYEVKADGPQTPARWRISAFASNTAGLGIDQTTAGGASGAANPIDNGVGPPVPIPQYWDGLARPTLGIGIGRSGAALNGSVLLTRIQVFAL